jgi:N-acetylneuraminate synthase
MWGTDHLSSIEPQGLFKLVSGIRELERAHGNGTKEVFDSEIAIRKKLRGY